MFSMRVRLLLASSALAAAIATSGTTAASAAGAVATNGGASQVTATTAVLNGTVDTTDAAAGDSLWYFQYGPTTNYEAMTKVNVIGKEDQAVSAEVSGLKPNTTYHFRLVVAQNINYGPNYSLSADETFTTSAAGSAPPPAASYGRAALKSHRLKIRSGAVSIPFTCSGSTGALCQGAVIIAATGKLGKSKQAKMYGCAGGSFSTVVGKTSTLKTRLSASCKTLLKHARHHQLAATLRATYSTHQSSLKTGVTLL